MNENINLKNKIMARIYARYLLRKTFSLKFISPAVFVGVVGYVALVVSIKDVYNNMPSGLSQSSSFFVSAFAHTEFAVQVALSLGLIALVAYASKLVIEITNQRSKQIA